MEHTEAYASVYEACVHECVYGPRTMHNMRVRSKDTYIRGIPEACMGTSGVIGVCGVNLV